MRRKTAGDPGFREDGMPVSPTMPETKARVPVKPGYYTVPEDPHATPEVICSCCKDCGEYFFPKRLVCAKCLSRNTEERTVPARGTLHSFTFVHIPLFGSTKIEYQEGYGVGQIDLPEGPRIQLPLVGKREQFRVGQPVTGETSVMREHEDKDVVILRFRPVDA
jgi:uncharacterized OB-fold protein